jgi:hypothetical protein
LLAQGRWFSPDTPASSTTKTGRHDIVAILLKVALSTNNHHPKSNNISSHYIINNIENLKIVTGFFSVTNKYKVQPKIISDKHLF